MKIELLIDNVIAVGFSARAESAPFGFSFMFVGKFRQLL